MQFTHHPRADLAEPWLFQSDRGYEQRDRPDAKPRGFWLSVDDDWRRWCESEEMGHWVAGGTVEFAVDTERLLILDTPYDIDQFTKGYQPEGENPAYKMCLIDWQRVADRYAGIIIAPYQWSRRYEMSTMWYYGWDCASACFWDLSVLTEKTREEAQ